MTKAIQFPFQDTELDLDLRVKDLISRLTLDEKIESMLQYQPAIERLGVGAYKHGTEAAHGLAWLGEATSFPQPVGLAHTWDPELMEEIGSVIGDEARVFYKRNPEVNGLTLWAPTVDMERDPRWGRNEEAYGEDPELTGELTAGLVKGMQGDHPKYYKSVATLKHFLANNNEVDRGSGSSSIDPRNMREYYLKAFEKPFLKGGAQSMMTAYNSINGTPALLHPFVNEVVKGEWGMDGFIVSDAGDVMGIHNDHKYYDSHTPGVVESILAGIDSITDDADLSKKAMREGLLMETLTESDLDQALFNTFRVRFRLGEFDPAELNPYASIGEESMMTEEAKALSLKAAKKQMVLLKNENDTLPLNKEKLQSVAVIGELGGVVLRDWYAGTLPYKVTPLEAIQKKLAGKQVSYSDANDRITLTSAANGKTLGVLDGEKPPVVANGRTETFMLSDWGFGSATLRAESNGKLLTSDEEQLTASAEEAYGWFVKEIIHLLPQEDGTVGLTTWNNKKVTAPNGGNAALAVNETMNEFGTEEKFKLEVQSDGIAEAVSVAKAAETAIVFVGNNPLINGKEEIDRPSLELPASQQRLIEAVYAANPNTVVVVVGAYPFTMNWVQENIPAIVYTSHAGQELGNAVADVLFGDYAPAGRLNMTWYKSEDQLTHIKDYDIIKSERTYQYFKGDVLYPFGHGLTYASFKYDHLKLNKSEFSEEDFITASVDITNESQVASEEVVQFYIRANQSRVKRPLKTLKGFRRIYLAPGETKAVTFELAATELAFWDVTRSKYCVESGSYRLLIGKSSADIQVSTDIQVEGEVIPARNLALETRAENYDDYSGVDLDESKESGTCVRAVEETSWVLYQGADFGQEAIGFTGRVSSEFTESMIEIRLGAPDGVLAGTIKVAAKGVQGWQTVFTPLVGAVGEQDVYIVLSLGVRLSRFTIA
ncbi:glycoside hydrolase family 3 protein [Paenibacillus sp. Marseille-Q4541]|uniref:glycoside hydrolase family 3 protein n=1 Tax=Paenibacillus sp. Marseille-Q4541 TaxID=2831522 RepID=UPI001BAC2E6E|nr:glycoside hydrolase family 3 protein [Paenibacillus sp. Marseille-Q4541]